MTFKQSFLTQYPFFQFYTLRYDILKFGLYFQEKRSEFDLFLRKSGLYLVCIKDFLLNRPELSSLLGLCLSNQLLTALNL